MPFPVSNRALLQSMMASVLVLAGATACSRPDTSLQGDSTAAGYRPMERDTIDATGAAVEPPEDLTEILRNVGDETADEQPVNANERRALP